MSIKSNTDKAAKTRIKASWMVLDNRNLLKKETNCKLIYLLLKRQKEAERAPRSRKIQKRVLIKF